MHKLTVLFLCTIFFLSSQIRDEQPPYLYYYSGTLESFVIQRADGTDLQILTPFVLPERQEISGPGWSPSGQWFVWTTTIPGGLSGSQDFTIWMVNRDGDRPVASFVGGQVIDMQWSPMDDLLLVKRLRSTESVVAEIDVIDAETSTLLFTVDQTELAEGNPEVDEQFSYSFLYVEWTPSGNYIAVYHASDQTTIDTMKVLSKTGEVLAERSFFFPENLSNYHPPAFPSWSLQDKILYVAPDCETLIIEDFKTSTELSLAAPYDKYAFIDWSPDANYIFLYSDDPDHDGNHELWLLSLLDQQITHLSSEANPSYTDGRGRLTALFPTTTWATQGQYGYFIEAQSRLYLVDLYPSVTVSSIAVPDQYTIEPYNSVFWTDADDSLLIKFEKPATYSAALYQYNLTMTDPIEIAPSVASFSVSSNGRYVAYTGCDHAPVCVFDRQMNQTYPAIGVESQSDAMPAGATGVFWHPDQDWIITIREMVIPWGTLGVSNATIDIQWSLNETCYLTASCYGWLPEVNGFE